MEKFEGSSTVLSQFLRNNMRQTTLIILFYVDKYQEALELMFKEPLSDNLEEALFDFLLISSVSRATFKRLENLEPEKELDPEEFIPQTSLKIRLAIYFTEIKQNLYFLIDQNLKKTFVKLFNSQKIEIKL